MQKKNFIISITFLVLITLALLLLTSCSSMPSIPTSITVNLGQTKTLETNGSIKAMDLSNCVSINQANSKISITGQKCGTDKIVFSQGFLSTNCRVTVEKIAFSTKKIIVNTDDSENITITGTNSNITFEHAPGFAVTKQSQTQNETTFLITGQKEGTYTLDFIINEEYFTVDVIVENPSLVCADEMYQNKEELVSVTGTTNRSTITCQSGKANIEEIKLNTFKITPLSSGELTLLVDANGKPFTKTINVSSHTHNFVLKEIVKSTCTTQGYTVYECDCGQEERDAYTDVTDHQYETTIIDATCEKDGKKIMKCTMCGHEETEIIPMLGHDLIE